MLMSWCARFLAKFFVHVCGDMTMGGGPIPLLWLFAFMKAACLATTYVIRPWSDLSTAFSAVRSFYLVLVFDMVRCGRFLVLYCALRCTKLSLSSGEHRDEASKHATRFCVATPEQPMALLLIDRRLVVIAPVMYTGSRGRM